MIHILALDCSGDLYGEEQRFQEQNPGECHLSFLMERILIFLLMELEVHGPKNKSIHVGVQSTRVLCPIKIHLSFP